MHHTALRIGLLCHHAAEKAPAFKQAEDSSLVKASIPCLRAPHSPLSPISFLSQNSCFPFPLKHQCAPVPLLPLLFSFPGEPHPPISLKSRLTNTRSSPAQVTLWSPSNILLHTCIFHRHRNHDSSITKLLFLEFRE